MFMTVTSKRSLMIYCEAFQESCIAAMLPKHMRFHAWHHDETELTTQLEKLYFVLSCEDGCVLLHLG